jgi:hypothetical protein
MHIAGMGGRKGRLVQQLQLVTNKEQLQATSQR